MVDRVLVPLPGIGTLELTREVYEAALRPIAREAVPAAVSVSQQPATEFLDAKALAAALSLPINWVREKGRQGTIPSVQVGRYVRYSLPAVRKALGATEGQSHGR